MAMTNAEKQAAWRARRDEELRALRLRVWELEKSYVTSPTESGRENSTRILPSASSLLITKPTTP
jgi:hypothetical protein